MVTTPHYVAMADDAPSSAPGAALAALPLIRLGRPGRSPLPSRRPPLPREQLSGLLSPVAPVTDEILFEDARNAQAKSYLPRYRLSEQTVGGRQQFRMRLEQLQAGATLTVFLERFPAPGLSAVVRDAKEVAHQLAVTLTARVPVGTSHIQQSLSFQEITFADPLVKAVLRLDGLAQVTQVFQFLTEAAFAASLDVSRAFSVAVPVVPDAIPGVQRLVVVIQRLNGELALLTRTVFTLDRQRQQLRRLVLVRPALKPRLAAVEAQRLQALRQQGLKRAEVSARNAELLALRRQPHFTIAAVAVNALLAPQPFVFPKDLHGYIFDGITPGSGTTTAVSLHQAQWKDRSHTYYQQALHPNRFYHLPDAFKVKRRPETPHGPMLTVRFPNPDAPIETMPVTIEYVAGPVVDGERLEAAALELRRTVPDLNPDAPVEFEPLLADTVRLFMTLPRGDAGPQVEERTTAAVDLRNGIVDAITLPMKDFQGAFDALFGASSVVLHGRVVVDLDGTGAIPAEQIPVSARLDDLTGDLFDVETAVDATTGGVRTTLTNAIESPLELRGLRARLMRGTATVEGTVSGLTFTPPPIVQPGASLICTVVPLTPLSGDGEVSVDLDLTDVKVQPDPAAVWDVIVDQSRLPEFTRTVKVKTIRQTFEPAPSAPSAGIVAAVIQFERGDSVELTAEHLETDVRIAQPMEDVILRRQQRGEYRYKVTVIRADGTQARDSEWRTDTTGILFPPLETGPAPV